MEWKVTQSIWNVYTKESKKPISVYLTFSLNIHATNKNVQYLKVNFVFFMIISSDNKLNKWVRIKIKNYNECILKVIVNKYANNVRKIHWDKLNKFNSKDAKECKLIIQITKNEVIGWICKRIKTTTTTKQKNL